MSNNLCLQVMDRNDCCCKPFVQHGLHLCVMLIICHILICRSIQIILTEENSNVNKHQSANAPTNMIIRWTTFDSNNCKFSELQWVFTVAVQNCFNSATVEGFRRWPDCLRSCHCISFRYKSELWLSHSYTLIWFLLRHSVWTVWSVFFRFLCVVVEV